MPNLTPDTWIHLIELGAILLLFFASKGREWGGGYDQLQRRVESLEGWKNTFHKELYEGTGMMHRLKAWRAAVSTAIALLAQHTGTKLPPLRED